MGRFFPLLSPFALVWVAFTFQAIIILIHGEDATDCDLECSLQNVTCDLECFNGGYCTLVPIGDVPPNPDLPLNVSLMERCVCRPGYAGPNCTIELEECSDPPPGEVRRCHNGVPCREVDHPSSNETTYECNCALAYEQSQVAGFICDHPPASETCGESFGTVPGAESFCVNGGTCYANMGLGQFTFFNGTDIPIPFQHLGCRCPPEFEGTYCEFLRAPLSRFNVPSLDEKTPFSIDGSSNSETETIVGVTISILSLAGLYGIYETKKRWSRSSFFAFDRIDAFLSDPFLVNDNDLAQTSEVNEMDNGSGNDNERSAITNKNSSSIRLEGGRSDGGEDRSYKV